MHRTNTARAAYIPADRHHRSRIGTAMSPARRHAVLDAIAHRRTATGRRILAAQLAAFRDATTAETKAVDLIDTGAIVTASRPGLYLAVASDGTDTYLIDLYEGSCTCQGHARTGHCYHRLAAVMVETGTAELLAA